MKLNSSPKIFNNSKCDFPENTIKKIQQGFDEIGLKMKYSENKIGNAYFSSYAGRLKIEGLGYVASGKGNSSISAKAASYAEMAERFSSRLIVLPGFPSVEDIPEYNNIMKDYISGSFLKGYVSAENSNNVTIEKINFFYKHDLSENEYNTLKKQKLLDIFVDSYSFINNEYNKIPHLLIDMMSGSNAVSGGNTIEEALVHSASEVFERYAALNVVTNCIKCPTIKKESIENDVIHHYLDLFNSLNIEVVIKDFRLKEKIPAIGIYFINHNIKNEKNLLKTDRYHQKLIAASHPNLEEAILSCLSEYIQIEEDIDELQYGKKADILYNYWTGKCGKTYKTPNDPLKYFFMYYDYYDDLSFLKNGVTIKFEELGSKIFSDCLDEFNYIIDVCKRNKWDTQSIDYTHQILSFPTVRVIIPPISTDYFPPNNRFLKISNYEERFNSYYGIKDFHRYVFNDDWLNDKSLIQNLIRNLEDYLSEYLFFYHIWLRYNIFHQFVNLFLVLAFAYLALEKYNEALSYFKFILELEDKPDFHLEYSDIIFGYTPSSILTWIVIIENILTKKDKVFPIFQFENNPFKRKNNGRVNSEYQFQMLLKNINDSVL